MQRCYFCSAVWNWQPDTQKGHDFMNQNLMDFDIGADKLREECGVFGMYDFDGNDVAQTIYYGLFALQHRGQESCGIAVSDTEGPKGKVAAHKGMGLCNEVFTPEVLEGLRGNIGVGHVRYSTAGSSTRENAQPLVLNYVKGTLGLAHNGNLVNAPQLRHELEYTGAIFQTTIDSEVIAYHIARARINTRNVESAVAAAMKKLRGAYSLVIMSPRKLIGARDPFGFKPLCIGKRDNAYILASETCALETIGAEFVRDVEPGEIVTITADGIIQQYGEAGLIVATLMAGVILILLGIFKLGAVIKFIPYPIIVGFTSGIAVTIFTTQIADIFGLNFGGEKVPGDFVGKWMIYFQHFDTINWWNTIVSIVSIAIIAITPKFSKKIPGSLIAIIVVTVAVYLMKTYAGINCIDTIGDRFSIKAELPDAVMPSLNWEAIQDLFPVAITIAVLGAIESLLSATVADGVIGDKHDSNTELIAQGAANLITPLFGGIPATGAIARTMANINNGGKTPVAGMVHAVVLLLILLFLMPLAQYIPMACLAGVLVIVSYNMSGWRTFKALLKNPKSDVTVLLITFFLTVIFDLTIAIEVGLVIACVLFMHRVMETTEISVIKDEINLNEESNSKEDEENLSIPKGVEVYEINGPYFFGIATKFEEIMSRLGDRPKVRIIRMRKVPFIDSTGIHNLTSLCQMAQREKTTIVLSGVNEKVHKALEKSGFYELLGEKNICPNINVALERSKELLDE